MCAAAARIMRMLRKPKVAPQILCADAVRSIYCTHSCEYNMLDTIRANACTHISFHSMLRSRTHTYLFGCMSVPVSAFNGQWNLQKTRTSWNSFVCVLCKVKFSWSVGGHRTYNRIISHIQTMPSFVCVYHTTRHNDLAISHIRLGHQRLLSKLTQRRPSKPNTINHNCAETACHYITIRSVTVLDLHSLYAGRASATHFGCPSHTKTKPKSGADHNDITASTQTTPTSCWLYAPKCTCDVRAFKTRVGSYSHRALRYFTHLFPIIYLNSLMQSRVCVCDQHLASIYSYIQTRVRCGARCHGTHFARAPIIIIHTPYFCNGRASAIHPHHTHTHTPR